SDATCSPLSSPSPGCSSSSAAASLPYLGPTGRCKKSKVDETAEMFKETLVNLNKSMATPSTAAPSLRPLIDINDPDILIGKSVESCLKSLTNMGLKLKYRRKFRSII
ncbi:Transcription factor adf-1-like protein, partial [Temnothorax longispinosus]